MKNYLRTIIKNQKHEKLFRRLILTSEDRSWSSETTIRKSPEASDRTVKTSFYTNQKVFNFSPHSTLYNTLTHFEVVKHNQKATPWPLEPTSERTIRSFIRKVKSQCYYKKEIKYYKLAIVWEDIRIHPQWLEITCLGLNLYKCKPVAEDQETNT